MIPMKYPCLHLILSPNLFIKQTLLSSITYLPYGALCFIIQPSPLFILPHYSIAPLLMIYNLMYNHSQMIISFYLIHLYLFNNYLLLLFLSILIVVPLIKLFINFKL